MALLSSERSCADCKKSISFDEFLTNHPQYTKERALLVWNDELLTKLCSQCFLNASEKPYKQNRYTYFDSYFKRKG